MFKQQTSSFKELKSSLKTGDILLMHGIHLSSRAIETIEGSQWSHVAIIVLADDIGLTEYSGEILLWESDTKTPVNDVKNKAPKSGPMLVKLEERLKYNFTHGEDSRCAIRHLYVERGQNFFNQFSELIPTVHNADFPDSLHEFINPAVGRFLHKKTKLDTLFCSELAAYTYQKLGLLTSIHPINSYFPLDFSEKLTLGLLNRAWLGNEINIEVDI